MITKSGRVVVGLKGRSGRKSRFHETAKIEAIQKAWEKVLRSINLKDVERIALPLALKDMTDKQEIQTNLTVEKITGMIIQHDDGTKPVVTIENNQPLIESNATNIQDKDFQTDRSSEVLDRQGDGADTVWRS